MCQGNDGAMILPEYTIFGCHSTHHAQWRHIESPFSLPLLTLFSLPPPLFMQRSHLICLLRLPSRAASSTSLPMPAHDLLVGPFAGRLKQLVARHGELETQLAAMHQASSATSPQQMAQVRDTLYVVI